MTFSKSIALAAFAFAATPALLPSAALAQPQSAAAGHMSYAREADQLRLGANGEEKCRAFRKVLQHSQEMQSADHGALTPGDTKRLMAELASAKAMAPHSLTAPKCGVPL